MSKSILTFDQIEILTKKSDSDHSDNDWLFITWFVRDQLIRTDKIPLLNQNGSRVLESGDQVLPISSEVESEDTDLVTATFVVVNLGSYDWDEQIDAAGKIASKLAEGLASAYVDAAQFVIANSGIPLGKVFSDGIELVQPAIVDSAGAFVEDVLVPGFQEIVDGVLLILGRPNCNGPVFHDIAVFKPGQPEPPLTLWKTYEADETSGCGSPARTSVHFTIDRDLDFVPTFPTTPPLQWDYVPSVNESPDNWLGEWANDPQSPVPLIYVSVEHSTAASGLFSISIKEDIDPRFHVTFATKADPIAPTRLHLQPYHGNVSAYIQPWTNHSVTPGPLQVFAKKLSHGTSGFAVATASGAADTSLPGVTNQVPPGLATIWKRSTAGRFTGGIPVAFPQYGAAEPFDAGNHGSTTFLETADGFRFKDRDITLAFYNIVQNGQVIFRALRYIRGATSAYTRADWMLAKWSPFK